MNDDQLVHVVTWRDKTGVRRKREFPGGAEAVLFAYGLELEGTSASRWTRKSLRSLSVEDLPRLGGYQDAA